MARQPSAESILRNTKQAERKVETHADIATDMILPNNSGEHVKGLKREAPIEDIDLVNKEYVDAQFPIKLNEVANPDASKTFNLGNNKFLNFTSVDRTPIADEGIFNFECSGNFTGDLVHIHQHTGNAGADTKLLNIESEDSDATCLNLIANAAGDNALNVARGKITTPGFTLASNTPGLILKDLSGTGSDAQLTVLFYDDANTLLGTFGFTSNLNSDFYIINNETGGDIRFSCDGDINAGANKITNVVDPAAAQDAATKNYVDDEIKGRQQFVSITVEDPTASEDIAICKFDEAVTITKVVGVIVGSTSVTIDLRHHTDRSNAGNEVLDDPEVISSTTTGDSFTSGDFDDATLPANSYLWLETTALSDTPDEVNITVFYTTD